MLTRQNTTRLDGVIKEWNDERGFGFIEPMQGGQKVFLHIKAIERNGSRPSIGQTVSFEVDVNQDGKKQAKNVQLPQNSRYSQSAQPARSFRNANRRNSSEKWSSGRMLAIPVFLFIYLLVAIVWSVPAWVAAVYLGASILTFFFYAKDKSAALAGRWRESEASLILLGLFCGWPGALIAQQMLRHKSSKAKFLAPFWLSVVVNVLAFIAINSPYISILPKLNL